MKIGYLTSEYPAPSHTFIRREVVALRETGAQIETFSVRRPHDTARFAEEDRAALEETRYLLDSRGALVLAVLWAFVRSPRSFFSALTLALCHRLPGARALLWSCFHFVEAMRLARLLHAREIAHLHNHFANSSAIVGMIATRYLGLGFSLTIHGISEFDGPAGTLLAEKIAACRFVACVSFFGRAQVMRMVPPREWPKLFISRCGLDVSARPRREPRTRGEDEKLRFCTVGRLSPEKGHGGLLEAFATARRTGVSAELHLVGDGPLRGYLECRAEELSVREHTVFHGQLSDDEVGGVIATSDIFVMSSFMEGLPVVIMESFAAGVPVIAPAVAGIPELVEDEETGCLFAPSDWDALAQEMTRLAEDPGMCARIGERGRRKVIEQHEITRAVVPLLERFAAHGLVAVPPLRDESGRKPRVLVSAAPVLHG